jgi:hypothetical protein
LRSARAAGRGAARLTRRRRVLACASLHSPANPRALLRSARAAHKWNGIIISEASAHDGTRAAIERSFDVRSAFEHAVELNPEDPTARHLLGLWHYEVASIGWLAKKAASALFAKPPSSSYHVALELLLAAEELSPSFYKKNQLLIAKAQLKLGEKAEARRWLASALQLPCANADDEAAHAEALALARTLG